MGQGQGMWSGLSSPSCHPEASQALHIPFSEGSSETVSFLYPASHRVFLCISGSQGLGGPAGTGPESFGAPRAVPASNPRLKQLGCNEKPQSEEASFTSLADHHQTVTGGPVRTGTGSLCVHGGVCFHIGDVCGNGFRSSACVYLCVCQFLWVYWCE